MKDHYLDPMSFQRSLQRPQSAQGTGRGVKKSYSVVGGLSGSASSGTVLSKFLRLGKAKSNAQGTSRSRSSSSQVDDLEDFRLSPSVLNRGPVDTMVHSSNKDLSRSHSWIYGSVKLPTDFPLGYGNGISGNPSGSESNSEQGSPQLQHNENVHHQFPSVQIPRCQMTEYSTNSCECQPAPGFLSDGNCQACTYNEWALETSKKTSKRSETGKSIVESVKKLTWKSLKQVVKKRPSLDNMRKNNEVRGDGEIYGSSYVPLVPLVVGNTNLPMDVHARTNGFFNYSPHAFSADDLQPNYFFPEKKNLYASCTDVYRDNVPKATASVRVRPKPSRQSWQFNDDSGPIPNYQEDNFYHSELDLRQCIPYDVWVNTTCNVKPKVTLSPTPSKAPMSQSSSISKSTSVPYLSEMQGHSSIRKKAATNDMSPPLSMKSFSAGTVNSFDTISLHSVASTVKTTASSSHNRSSEGIVKRPSILAADINAYQLLKAQTKGSINGNKRSIATGNTETLSSSSDDLSDNAITSENHMRIAGQRIYMPSNAREEKLFLGQSKREEKNKNANMNIATKQVINPADKWTDESSRKGKGISPSRSSYDEAISRHSNNFNNNDNVRVGQRNSSQKKRSDIATQTSPTSHNQDDSNDGDLSSPVNTKSHSPSNPCNYYHQDAQNQTQVGIDGNGDIEFEEFVFEDKEEDDHRNADGLRPQHKDRSGNHTNGDRIRKDHSRSQDNLSSTPINNQRAGKKVSLANSFHNNKSNEIIKSNGVLRRRKSRNGGNNPGKLLKEVIYEEEMENGQDIRNSETSSPSGVSSITAKTNNSKWASANEHAVKIVVSSGTTSTTTTTTEYVKPILKNRERVYDAPVNVVNGNDNGTIYSSLHSASHVNDSQKNDIYFESSVSITSTLKKKVQFDRNEVMVCGGDSGPDSDECSVEDEEKSYGNYANEDNTSCEKEDTNDASDPTERQKANESGSVSFKSNLARRSVLNDYDDRYHLNGNQSHESQQIGSTFAQEVANKAASLAFSRRNKEEAARENNCDDSAKTCTKDYAKSEECYDEDVKVNNPQPKRVNEKDQSQLASRSTCTNYATTTSSPLQTAKRNNNYPTGSHGSCSDQPNHDDSLRGRNKLQNETTPIGKERHFIKNSKATHGVAAQVLKAKRTAAAVGKCLLVNDTPPPKTKIVNPNSLLFNDTTRIRLNQSRPSLSDAFPLQENGVKNGATKGSKSQAVRLKQSNSFRVTGSVALRPKEPPPPPPTMFATSPAAKSNLPTTKSHLTLSSSISSQLDKILSKSTPTSSQLPNSFTSLNGHRMLSKSEISLPMGLKTTTNQIVSVTENQNTHGQNNHNNNGNNNNHNGNGNKTSGFEGKTPIPTNTKNYKKIDSKPNNKYGSKSSPKQRREVVNNRVAETRPNTSSNELKSNYFANKKRNANPTGVKTHDKSANLESMKACQGITASNLSWESSKCSSDKQKIEIVTKDNEVNEIRIYSGTSSIVSPSNISTKNTVDNYSNHEPMTASKSSRQEIHYAATDISQQEIRLSCRSTNGRQYPHPPSIPRVSNGADDRPYGSSVVLLGDNNNYKSTGNASSPMTYSQPIDTLKPVSGKVLMRNEAVAYPDETEPLYDDVVPERDPYNDYQAKPFLTKSQQDENRDSISGVSPSVISSSLPCLACPPSLPPPNLPAKNLSEFAERPLVLQDDSDNRVTSEGRSKQMLDEEVDIIYNDISDGKGQRGSSSTLQSFANSMKGALLNAIRNIDFDRRSVISGVSNHSNGSQNRNSASESCNMSNNFIYDDTLSLHSANTEYEIKSVKSQSQDTSSTKTHAPRPSSTCSDSSTIKCSEIIEEYTHRKQEEDSDPLYDDVNNYSNIGANKERVDNSDSGAESEDAVPPPLPAQGPPKLTTTDLPILEIIVDGIRSQAVSKLGKEEQHKATITRTKSLLQELNEKLSEINGASSSSEGHLRSYEFSSYLLSKQNTSSSSASSGVEEDYNSEKNYSLSNSINNDGQREPSPLGQNNKIAQMTQLVNETITSARGKFLDSMKSQLLNSSANQGLMVSTNNITSDSINCDSGSSPCINDEPIYEEIGDINRSSSPIYADAFDVKSIFDGASRNEILSFLESIRDRLTNSESASNSSDSKASSIKSKQGNDASFLEPCTPTFFTNHVGDLANHENDEIGEISQQNAFLLRKLCSDCNTVPVGELGNDVEGQETEKPDGSICTSCNRNRSERKEIITEIHETEIKYGRDLKIIMEEFYRPIQIAGLLNKEQLDQIFLNVNELMDISIHLTELLKGEIQEAVSGRQDEDLSTVSVGKIFLSVGDAMMAAFQTYCTRQASAGSMLSQLEKEKELLRIFLRVSQIENAVLRRMNLPAFLMVPVQRVTRYPLLLSRLLKVTPPDHPSREELQSAHNKVEQHLEQMNRATCEATSTKLWRRISIINGNNGLPVSRRPNNELEVAPVSIRKISLDILDWSNFTDVSCVMDTLLGVLHFNGKPIRGVYACLLVRGNELENLASKMESDMFFPPADDTVKEVKLILVRMKNNRLCPLREPLCLANCIVSQGENEFQDFVEINEITTKNTYHLQGVDKQATGVWLKYLQGYAMCVGNWRKRRGALANIMMNGMLKHL